jgi:hypothetical protein
LPLVTFWLSSTLSLAQHLFEFSLVLLESKAEDSLILGVELDPAC